MRSLGTNVRNLLFLLVAFVAIEQRPLGASMPTICEEYCSSSTACEDQCYLNMMEFENGNDITCLEYGVYDTSAPCCGDSICSFGQGEASYCASDCGNSSGCNECNVAQQTGCATGKLCNRRGCCVDAPSGGGNPPRDPVCYEDYCEDSGDCCPESYCWKGTPQYTSVGVCVPDIVPPPGLGR